MATETFRYCRPEEYRTRVEQVPGPIESCSFAAGERGSIRERAAMLERVSGMWLSPGYLDDLRQAFVQYMGRDFNGTVLEVGCGMGHLHRKLGLSPERYVGVEINEAFLELGRKEYPGLRLIQGAAEDLSSLGEERFDCVLCSDVLIHLRDMLPALRELIRVSRDKVLLRIRSGNGAAQGSKTIYDAGARRLFNRMELEGAQYHVYYNVLAPEDLRELLRQAGITQYETIDLLPANADRLGLTKVCFDVRQAKRG